MVTISVEPNMVDLVSRKGINSYEYSVTDSLYFPIREVRSQNKSRELIPGFFIFKIALMTIRHEMKDKN
jgi:hypothetical protein